MYVARIPQDILRHARGTGCRVGRFHTCHKVDDDLRARVRYPAHQWAEPVDPFTMEFFQ